MDGCPSYLLYDGDNIYMSVLHNTQKLESTLKRRSPTLPSKGECVVAMGGKMLTGYMSEDGQQIMLTS